MKKEHENKLFICLYLMIILLVINSITLFIIASRLNPQEESASNSQTSQDSSTTYDVSMFTSLTAKQVTQKIKSGDQFLLFIGYEGCTFCKKMLPNLQKAQESYKYTTVYLDIDKADTSSTDYKEMASLLNIKKTVNNETKEFGQFQYTPMIAVINDGKMVDGMIGYNTYENLVSFLEKAGIQK
ncbi:MAG: thioredoxin family protein [Bacilli bacterium]|nr:thioredoxin family protein [Bacilli bacterium]